MPNAPFPIQPVLTAIAIAYRNGRLIADEVLPRVPAGAQEFKYWLFNKAEAFTLPDTKVGRRSKPNQVEFSATEQTSATEDYGLDDPIPQNDIDNAPPNYDPLGHSTEQLTNLILLDREVRVSNLVFSAANYPTGNKVTLSGTSQWSDFTNSNPIDAIMTALDACIMRPNIAVFGRATFTKLAQHPRIVKAVLGNAGDSGVARRRDIAELLELDDVLVGEGWLNTARKGQAPSLSRVWGKHAAFLYRDRNADTRSGTAFGYTVQFGSRVAGSIPDPDIGLKGGQRIRAGESVKELITASDLGYFFENAVA